MRALYSEIDRLKDISAKERLLNELAGEAMVGLEEDLQDLLRENGLSDKALQLVRDYTTRKSDLAKKLYLSEISVSDKDEPYLVMATKLLPKLETLGALLSNNIQVGSANWVQELTTRSPTLIELRRMNYSDLNTLLEEGNATNGERSVVENLFAKDNKIREQCQRYGAGLETAETLEEQGVKSASDMSREQLDEFTSREGSDKKKASALKKMYFNESSERAKEREKRAEKMEQNKKRTEEAKNLAQEARNAANEATAESQTKLKDIMKKIADNLSLPEGWDKQEKDDPNALLEQLNREIKIASDSLAIPPYVSNEEVVAAASGGLALYGMMFDDKGFSKRPPFPLLKKPEYVEWLSPALGFEVRFFKSTEQQASTKFYKTAKSSGLSIAASVSGGGWGFHASASAAHSSESSDETSNKQQRQTTHATVTQYVSQPTKAFRIPREDMELNDEAISKAKEIQDEETAKRFLKMYGSHVSEGVHTLGGVFFRNMNVNTEREASVSDVLMAAGNQLDTEVSAGYSGFGFSVGGSVKTGSFEASGSRKASSTEKISYMSEMTVQTLGPPTTNAEMFSQLLQGNNATWYVIDRGDRDALVPVWKLLPSGLEKQARRLEEVWKEKEKKKQEMVREEISYDYHIVSEKS